jgi:hypothetical protein
MRQIIDKHYDNDDFKFVFSEGSNATVLVDVQTLGDADTSLTGYTAKIYYYDHVDDTVFYEIDSDSLDATTGRFTFNVQPADLAIEGAYPAEIVIIDGSSNPFVHAYGSVIIKDSILQAGTTALTTGPVINYAIFSSYQNVATSGPYRAGTNITFSSNADGSVDIDAASGGANGGSVALVSGQDYIVVTGLALASTPDSVVVSVSKPTSGNYNIFATVVEDTITTDGFRVELSATPDNGNYKLKYITA